MSDARSAAPGSVNIQAYRILVVTPQRTAESFPGE